MTYTRTLHPWEPVQADDDYAGKPIGDRAYFGQAGGFSGPVTRRITVTLDSEDAMSLVGRLDGPLPHSGKLLAELVNGADREAGT